MSIVSAFRIASYSSISDWLNLGTFSVAHVPINRSTCDETHLKKERRESEKVFLHDIIWKRRGSHLKPPSLLRSIYQTLSPYFSGVDCVFSWCIRFLWELRIQPQMVSSDLNISSFGPCKRCWGQVHMRFLFRRC
jgi:hypothetical protein